MLGRPKFKKWWGPPKSTFSVLSLITNGTILRIPPNLGVKTLWWGHVGGDALVGRHAVMGRPHCGGETPLWWGDPAVVGRPLWGKGRWARNGPFPFKNGLLGLQHIGPPKRQMGQKPPVSF